MHQTVKTLGLMLCMLIFSISASATIPNKPNPPRLVNDFAGIFAPNELQQLEQYLVLVDDSTSNQIVVVTVNDLGNYDKAQFATELGQQWGVGDASFDNGIVLLIKPKVGNQSGEVFIAVGYGLEAVIPDAIAKRIIEEVTIPYFRQNDYYGGALATVQYLHKLAKGEIDVAREAEPDYTRFVIFLVIFILFIIIASNSKKNNTDGKGGTRHTSYGGAPWIITGGSGGFGRSSGGGFGGFSGGGFGGGGAGGRW
ncbi:MAG TPA: TPM domain-containing protein [Paludibacteraceae bacterium]|nr:TPM domain-containing protein [Paludibacteraceae bacterium]